MVAITTTKTDIKQFSDKQQLEQLRIQLENERSSFIPHWRDLSDHILPTRGRFFVGGSNKGARQNLKIIDSTATLAVRTLRSGFMTGVSSPARPWFKLASPDQDVNDVDAVKEWLTIVETIMRSAFLRSNLYKVLPIVYGDMGTFGVGAIFMEEDPDVVSRFYTFPIGSYMLGSDEKGRIRVFLREFEMSVRQIVEKFGRAKGQVGINWENISHAVKSLYEQNNLETLIYVCHVVKPNEKHDPNKLESKFKKYSSDYYEKGISSSNSSSHNNSVDDNKFLSRKGYDYFPVMAPRWETTGEDVYATNCPGMTALGDVKQLQLGEKRSAEAIDKMVRPPMVGSSKLRNSSASILPGDITYLDDSSGNGFRPAHEVRFDINALEQKQQQIRQRVSRAFYEDLFLMLANTDRRQITAREIDERHEEKLLALGSVLENVNDDLFDPLIDNQFAIMVKQGLIPEAPEELQGKELKVEYISIMAQAQKMTGIGGIERLAGYVGQIAQIKPNVVDKFDFDNSVDNIADLLGTPVNLIRSEEDVEAIREQQAQAAQAAQQQEKAAMTAETAQTMSETPVGDSTALDEMLQLAETGV